MMKISNMEDLDNISMTIINKVRILKVGESIVIRGESAIIINATLDYIAQHSDMEYKYIHHLNSVQVKRIK